ncbi:MAG: geranylgeranylglyceryl/heptaprenylglyceryl phosphate synthase [Candidatus Anstonellales archaeon]
MKVGRTEKYLLEEIEKKKGLLLALIDPADYQHKEDAIKAGREACEGGADAILVGGSIGAEGELLDTVTKEIKSSVSVPVILFPGNISTISKYADAVYFMSLLNSRHPYWITGAQMLAANSIRLLGIEPLPVGYIVIEPGGTVGYVGDANLISRNKPQIAAAHALSAQYMGFRFVLTDAGSNPSLGPIPLDMVKAVSSTINIPYIVAGGIKSPTQAAGIIKAGADAIQVGTALEHGKNLKKLVGEMVRAIRNSGLQKTK